MKNLFLTFVLISRIGWSQTAPKTLVPAVVPAPNSSPVTSINVEKENQLKVQQHLLDESIKREKELQEKIDKISREGILVRLKDVAHFRGVRSNQLFGVGVVVGLAGTGDSKSTPVATNMILNALKSSGYSLAPNTFAPKNVAFVSVTAELPPFVSPGVTIDINVQSAGDAKSLQGGTLLRVPLYTADNNQAAAVVAQGTISLGGFAASSGGSSASKNSTTVGRIPGGGIVERSVPTQFVFNGNRLFLDLEKGDITTTQRTAKVLQENFKNFEIQPIDGGTLQITLPPDMSPIQAMSEIEMTHVPIDIPAQIIINENTGTIVMGGDIKLGPAIVAHGGLQVVVQQDLAVSQPEPLSGGTTVAGSQNKVGIKEQLAQVGIIPPNATINDLAKIFQVLKLAPNDIASILHALHAQGALKARIKLQ